MTVLTRVSTFCAWFLYMLMACLSVKKSSQPLADVVQLVYEHLQSRGCQTSSNIYHLIHLRSGSCTLLCSSQLSPACRFALRQLACMVILHENARLRVLDTPWHLKGDRKSLMGAGYAYIHSECQVQEQEPHFQSVWRVL